MKKSILILCLFFVSWGVKAHNPSHSSTMIVEQGDKWILQIRAAMTGFEYEVHHHYGKDAYKTPEEFMDLVKSHIQDNFSIVANDGILTKLDNGIVKLGHETNVIFQINGLPKSIQSLTVKNSSFSDIPRNQSALMIYKDGFKKEQFILNNKNEHSAQLKVGAAQFELIGTSPEEVQDSHTTPSPIFFLGVLALLIIVFFVIKKRASPRLEAYTTRA